MIRAGCKPHDDEADHGIPESCNRPGQRHGKQYECRKVENRGTAWRQRERGKPQRRGHCCNEQQSEDRTTGDHSILCHICLDRLGRGMF
jgi:hypothetical protein